MKITRYVWQLTHTLQATFESHCRTVGTLAISWFMYYHIHMQLLVLVDFLSISLSMGLSITHCPGGCGEPWLSGQRPWVQCLPWFSSSSWFTNVDGMNDLSTQT